jgi:hypothetical protein
MSAKRKDVAGRLEVLFKRLDEAKLAPETILKSESQRGNYESILMFAFRKLQAARYHRQRVDDLIGLKGKELTRLEAASKPEAKGLTAAATMRTSRSSDEFAFELCAFFAAIRSGIDFIAVACAQHIKEAQQATSITTLLKLITNGKKGPILKAIAEDAEWLSRLREYRDTLFTASSFARPAVVSFIGRMAKRLTTPYTIVVPSETPQNVPDTRRERAFDEPESRFSVATSKAL